MVKTVRDGIYRSRWDLALGLQGCFGRPHGWWLMIWRTFILTSRCWRTDSLWCFGTKLGLPWRCYSASLSFVAAQIITPAYLDGGPYGFGSTSRNAACERL
ncbi:hypothetical protein CUC08_Gglean012889 [Alternaria sp. MG1]|nr:hypothetical protein CUC08_Gglean012889 [Alternaria sp. MG1]